MTNFAERDIPKTLKKKDLIKKLNRAILLPRREETGTMIAKMMREAQQTDGESGVYHCYSNY